MFSDKKGMSVGSLIHVSFPCETKQLLFHHFQIFGHFPLVTIFKLTHVHIEIQMLCPNMLPDVFPFG